MNGILELEISRAKADALREGYTLANIKHWAKLSDAMLARLGFSNASDVRRLADKFGRRAE